METEMSSRNAYGSEKITISYYITREGWVYTDSFGCAVLEGRLNADTGVTERNGQRILTLPVCLDGMDVYIIAFDGEYDDGVTDVIVPEGIGIIGPHAFWGWRSLRRISIPDSVRVIDEGAFFGTGIPRRLQLELYRRQLNVTEITEAPDAHTEPGHDIPF